MTVFIFNMKRILSQKVNIITMLALPILIMLLTPNVQFYRDEIKLAIFDKDKTAVTENIIDSLKTGNKVVNIKETDIDNDIKLKKIDYAIIFNKGYSKDIMNDKEGNLQVYYYPNSNIPKALNKNLNNSIEEIRSLAVSTKGDVDKFNFELGKLKNNISYTEVGDVNKISIRLTLSFLVMFMLTFSIEFANLIYKNKESDIDLRTFSAPLSIKSYLFQSILSLFVVSVIQITCTFVFMFIYFKSAVINFIPYLYVIFLSFSMTSVALGILVTSLSKRIKNSTVITGLITTPMCMLGGCYWANSMMPVSLQKISYLVPTTWVINAMENVIFNEGSLLEVGKDVSILLMFTVVFLLLGAVTKKEIIK